jgi:PAS domain S-box-containing protein
MNIINPEIEESKLLFEDIQEGIWKIDKDAYTIYVNDKLANMLGYSIDEMLGKHLFSFMDKEAMIIATSKLENRKKGEREVHEFEFVHKSGKKVQTLITTSPIIDSNGVYNGAIATLLNISELKRVEDLMKRSEMKFKKIFYCAPIGTCIINPKGKLLEVNDVFLKITGYSRDEIFNVPVKELTHPDDREMNIRFAKKALEGELDEYRLEKRYLRKDGSITWVDMSVSVVRDTDKNILYSVVMLKDITEERKAKIELMKAERLAAIGKMSAYLSHEIKSPLSVIKMNLDLMISKNIHTSACNMSLSLIRKEIEHIDHLLQNVLNYSRHSSLNFVNISMREKINSIAQGINHLLAEKQIEIKNYLGDEKIFADAQKIQSLFTQLIDNSIEAIGNNGVIEFTSSVNRKDKFMDIFIKDSGCGFRSPNKVFEPFYTTKSSGTGLGLAIAKKIVNQHNGSIQLISSKPGETIFKISLPLTNNGKNINN